MRPFLSLASAWFAIAALTLSVGCAGPRGAGTIAPLADGLSAAAGAHPVSANPMKTSCPKAQRLFVSDFSAGDVAVFCQVGSNQTSVFTIAVPYPQGMWIDSKANLYVAEGGANAVAIYNAKTLKATGTSLTGTSGEPAGVCGDNKGHVYVTDGGTTSIDVYTNGTKSSTLTDSNGSMVFCAVDSHGDLFVDYATGNTGGVDEFPAGSTTPTVLPIVLKEAGGMRCDKHNDLYVVDPFGTSSGSTITSYAPPWTGKGTTVVTATGELVGFAFNGSETDVWAANAVTLDAQEYSVSTGQLVDSTATTGFILPVDVVAFPAGPQ